jgi:hypothetical protein
MTVVPTAPSKQVVRLHQLLHEARFDEPKGDHLSPAGEYNLRLGVMKELHPELIATHQGETGCCRCCMDATHVLHSGVWTTVVVVTRAIKMAIDR